MSGRISVPRRSLRGSRDWMRGKRTQQPMTKDEIIQKHKKYLFNCVTNYYKDPLVIDHAKGQYVCDLEGRQYLDFLGGIVTISVGHSNEKVTAKIKAQIDRVQHTSTLFPTEAIVALAEKMAQIAPGNL